MSSHLLLPSLFFFLFFSPLTWPHEAEEWWSTAHFGLFWQPYWPESGLISLFQPESNRIIHFGSISVGIGPNRSQSAGFVPNRAELKKEGESAHRTSDSTSGRVRCGCGGPEVAPMLSSWFVGICWDGTYICVQETLSISLFFQQGWII